MTTKPRILIADDHTLVRETLQSYLAEEIGADMTGVGSFDEAMAAIESDGPFDLVMLDYRMPQMNGVEALKAAQAANGDGRVAIISGVAALPVVREMLAAGAAGFVPKAMQAQVVALAVRMMLAGQQFSPSELLSAGADDADAVELSRRESQVLGGLGRGLSNKEIASELELQEVTIKLHVKTLCQKLGARNRTDAAMIGRERGMI